MNKYDVLPIEPNLTLSIKNDTTGRNSNLCNLLRLLNSQQDSSSTAINGSWGTGKTFFIKKDNCGDEENPNPEYDVNTKGKNNSIPIFFDENKFTYVIGDSKNTSGQGEKIIIKPGETRTTNRVFSRIAEQQTVGGAVINYDNKELVQANFANPSGSVTANGNPEDEESGMNNTSSDIEGENHHNTAEKAKELLESKQRELGIIGPIGAPIKEMPHSWIFFS